MSMDINKSIMQYMRSARVKYHEYLDKRRHAAVISEKKDEERKYSVYFIMLSIINLKIG